MVHLGETDGGIATSDLSRNQPIPRGRDGEYARTDQRGELCDDCADWRIADWVGAGRGAPQHWRDVFYDGTHSGFASSAESDAVVV